MSFLSTVTLRNFRRFDNFTVRLSRSNVVVGPNNAGKSSILDAFRLLDACYRHARRINPKPLSIHDRGVFDGYEIAESILPFSLSNITLNYNDDDSIVEFKHENGASAVILMHPDRPTRFYIDAQGKRLTSSSMFRSAFPINLILVPTISPLEVDEAYLADTTVQRNSTTRLASRAFRNIWLRSTNEEFDRFRGDVESAWGNILLKKPELRRTHPPKVEMFFSEDRVDREVQWAGFGFQVWMQLHSHMHRGDSNSILVIDEPDIYLHPDLQNKLMSSIRARFGQYVLATHSIEIINGAETNEIVSINSRYKSSKRVKSDDDLGLLYNYIGSTINSELSSIDRARKVLFYEGRDHKIVRKIAARLGFDNLSDPRRIPIVAVGGLSQWRRAAHAVWALKNIMDIELEAKCVFDRDYLTESEVTDLLAEASTESLECFVWDRKELENYLLDIPTLERAIHRRAEQANIDP